MPYGVGMSTVGPIAKMGVVEVDVAKIATENGKELNGEGVVREKQIPMVLLGRRELILM